MEKHVIAQQGEDARDVLKVFGLTPRPSWRVRIHGEPNSRRFTLSLTTAPGADGAPPLCTGNGCAATPPCAREYSEACATEATLDTWGHGRLSATCERHGILVYTWHQTMDLVEALERRGLIQHAVWERMVDVWHTERPVKTDEPVSEQLARWLNAPDSIQSGQP